MTELPNYDRWLEAPYQRAQAQEPPDDIEELIGARVLHNGDVGWVESFETWEDADEDGRYSGIDLIVRWESGRTSSLSPDEARESLKPASEQYVITYAPDFDEAYVRDLSDEMRKVFTGSPKDAEAWIAGKEHR